MVLYSPEYVEHLKQGPFPHRIDPWGEIGWYFQQIHAGMIGNFAEQLDPQLMLMGYFLGREASLQIANKREPDIFIESRRRSRQTMTRWTYQTAAEALKLEGGVAADDELDLDALYIRKLDTGDLVTIVEVVSPSNKVGTMLAYREYRAYMLHQGVNVVEIDITRSEKRLLQNRWTNEFPYHIAIHLPNETPLVIPIEFDQSLKSFALPLQNEVISVDTQMAYDYGYRIVTVAGHLNEEGDYTLKKLPFPSLLTEVQKQELVADVQEWRKKLQTLKQKSETIE
jgi:hypothetical protein